MSRKKGTKLQYGRLFAREYKRAQRIVDQLSKAGYSVDSEYYQEILSTLSMDKKQGFQALEQLTKRARVLENTYKVDIETGERVPILREQFERLTSIPKSYEYNNPIEYMLDAPRYAEIAIQNFHMELQTYDALIVHSTSAKGKSKVQKWFDDLIEQYGTEAVGRMLMDASEHGIQLSFEVMYSADSATNFINEMMNFLDTSYSQHDEDILKGIYTEMNDGERLMEDEDGNPIL